MTRAAESAPVRALRNKNRLRCYILAIPGHNHTGNISPSPKIIHRENSAEDNPR